MAKETTKKAAGNGKPSGYSCARQVKHNGRRYQEGDAIELTDDLAAPLLDCGAIVSASGPATPGDGAGDGGGQQ